MLPTSSKDLLISFSESVTAESAEKLGHYSIDQDISLLHASLYGTLQTVLLETEGHVSGQSYVLTVEGITDTNSVVMPEPVQIEYTYAQTIWYDNTQAELANGARTRIYPDAITGSAAYCPEANSTITFRIYVPETGNWYLWGRMMYRGSDNDPNSFLLSVDGGAEQRFGNNGDMFQMWHWDGDGNRQSGPGVALNLGTLEAGSHTLEFKAREPLGNPGSRNMFLDGIVLTPESDFTPTDMAIVTSVEVATDGFENPVDYKLAIEAYPNPFNCVVRLNILDSDKAVNIRIYNPLGQQVAEWQQVETGSVQWNARHFPSSMYLVHVESGEHTVTRKILLLK